MKYGNKNVKVSKKESHPKLTELFFCFDWILACREKYEHF